MSETLAPLAPLALLVLLAPLAVSSTRGATRGAQTGATGRACTSVRSASCNMASRAAAVAAHPCTAAATRVLRPGGGPAAGQLLHSTEHQREDMRVASAAIVTYVYIRVYNRSLSIK